MSDFLKKRTKTEAPIFLIDNPSFSVEKTVVPKKIKGIVFCGNLGRLQLIPLIIEAVEIYLKTGRELKFCFIGGGVHSKEIASLAKSYEQVEYLGVLSSDNAEAIVRQYQWALLPLQEGVSRYAFPSKSSSYVMAGCSILGISDVGSSLWEWVQSNQLGYVCSPSVNEVVDSFGLIEQDKVVCNENKGNNFLEQLKISSFVSSICYVLEKV